MTITPTVLVFAYIGTRLKQKELKAINDGKKGKSCEDYPLVHRRFPAVGCAEQRWLYSCGSVRCYQERSKLSMVTALTAIGLSTSITDFKKAGLKPMFYGIMIDTLVTLTALVVIWCMGLM